ncbi:unnamed protein product [Rotaria sp. Silwood2]|nr:unnamed protein product [Rotaria sp. Silwood2]
MTLIIIADPSLCMRITMIAISVATIVAVVTSVIVVGIIVSKPSGPFLETKIVLKLPTQVVLNRFIEPYELPLFYNALETMNICTEDIKKVLKTKFGDKFVNLELIYFSPTPNITFSEKKKLIFKRKVLRQYDGNSNSGEPTATLQTAGKSTVYPTNSSITEDTTSSKCTILVITSYSTDTLEENTNGFAHTTARISNAPQPVDMKSSVIGFSSISEYTDDQNHLTTTPVRYTSDKISQFSSTTSTIFNINTSRCNTSHNAIGHPSIKSSKMFLYFHVRNGETILVPEIIDALKDSKPPIVVFTRCGEPSTKTSSFNQTLSKIESPTQVDIDLEAIKTQPSIPSALQASVTKKAEEAVAAAIAANELQLPINTITTTSTTLLSTTTTTTSTTPLSITTATTTSTTPLSATTT